MKYKTSDVDKILAETDRRIRPLVDAVDVSELTRFNRGYERYTSNKFYYFIDMERKRLRRALELVLKHNQSGSVADLGCFIPYLPCALSLAGFSVRMVDKYSLYSPKLKDAIANFAGENLLKVHDLDLLNEPFDELGQNEAVLLTSVLEHLNGSPRELLRKARNILLPTGIFVVQVPNIAEFTRRVLLLFGRSPLIDYETYFRSDYPFMGHNREMTVKEVEFMLVHSGFRVTELACEDLSPPIPVNWKAQLIQGVKWLAPLSCKTSSITAAAVLK